MLVSFANISSRFSSFRQLYTLFRRVNVLILSVASAAFEDTMAPVTSFAPLCS